MSRTRNLGWRTHADPAPVSTRQLGLKSELGRLAREFSYGDPVKATQLERSLDDRIEDRSRSAHDVAAAKRRHDLKGYTSNHPEDRKVLRMMPTSVAQITARTGLHTSRVGASLSRLQRAGLIERDGKGWKRTQG